MGLWGAVVHPQPVQVAMFISSHTLFSSKPSRQAVPGQASCFPATILDGSNTDQLEADHICGPCQPGQILHPGLLPAQQ